MDVYGNLSLIPSSFVNVVGFFPDNSGGNTGSGNNQSTGKKPLNEHSLRPVTVKQLQSVEVFAENTQTFFIDGAEVTQVKMMGVIRDVNEQSTNTTYRIEDGTGSIEVRKWNDQNETNTSAAVKQVLLNDMYVVVSARLNNFNNRISLLALDIRPITDYNEITFHLLDAVYNHVKLKNKDDPMQISSGNTGNSVYDQIYSVIIACKEEEGIHMAQIVQQLSGRLSEMEIKNGVDYLINDGRCYNTVDEDHVRSADNY
ncbi:hypothetical protein [Absidia glauca]|uniref:Replication protein A C-terminal domain-containing protein n=1 Tax=Absidia glauca TaxID=4829 RepID=A0A168NK57_ABSGL|nr:hypothetical protein [Absidia glauca]